jgi:hypothetical protein
MNFTMSQSSVDKVKRKLFPPNSPEEGKLFDETMKNQMEGLKQQWNEKYEIIEEIPFRGSEVAPTASTTQRPKRKYPVTP